MSENTPIHALIGTVASVILFSVPGGPLLGGAIAGYLDKGGRSRATRLGAIVGVCTMIVLSLAYLLVGRFLIEGIDPRLVASFTDILGGVILVSAVYVFALCVVGSVVGDYIATSRRAS